MTDHFNCQLDVGFQKLCMLRELGYELGDYKPHAYDEEGEPGELAELDSICLSESHFSVDDLQNLDSRFYQLAVQCRPDLMLDS